MKLFFIVSLFMFGVHSSDVSLVDTHSSEDDWIDTDNFILKNEDILSSFKGSHIYSVPKLPLRKFTKEELKKDIPKNYNVVDEFTSCTHLGVIPNQANCGSCWALSVAGALSDRFCIATEGKVDILLSGEDILSCSKSTCKKGGTTEKAWHFAKTTGIVTGGNYDSNEGCQPYSIKPCGVEGNECKSVAPTPKCEKSSCTNQNYKIPFNTDIHKASKIYRLSNSIEDIQREILINGPVVATFDVYPDFLNYTKGIYKWKETSGKKLGHHNVKIVGWGTCKMCGMKYWISANTWGNQWGEAGYFKILRGTNKVGFEKKVTAGLPKLN